MGQREKQNRNRMHRSSKPKDTRTRNWISKVAKAAVSPNPGFKKAYIKKLDFSPQSLTALDEIIWTLFGGRYLCKTKLEALVWGFGGYVAEVIQRNNEGFWKKAKNRYTFEFTRDEKITGFSVNPWAWIYKRFEEGDLLAAKYDELMKIAKRFHKASANSDFQKGIRAPRAANNR